MLLAAALAEPLAASKRRRPSGPRLSAEDLRQRGVDEAFLARPDAVDSLPAQVIPEDTELGEPTVSFVAGSETTRVECGAIVADDTVGDAASGGAEVRSRLEQEPEWSAKRLEAAYGLGYALLVGMGYQGGGRTPLCGVKRVARVGLQDNEELALDDSGLPASKRRRTAEAQGDESTEDEELCHLGRAILRELRAAPGCQMPIPALARRQRVRRAMADRPEVGLRMQQFLRRFLRKQLADRCRVLRSAALAWKSISGSSSAASWAQAARQETVVRLRSDADSADESGAEGSSGWSSGDQTSSPEPLSDLESHEQEDSKVSGGGREGWHCHGCGQRFASQALLREHLSEKLAARTTRDPTNVHAKFDPDHADREVLEFAARSSHDSSSCWKCPVCKQGPAGMAQNFLQLLDHLLEHPRARVEHQRVLLVVTELLIREPPPAHVVRAAPAGPASWCSPGLERLFESITKGNVQSYSMLEEELLGRPEQDMFGGDLFSTGNDKECDIFAGDDMFCGPEQTASQGTFLPIGPSPRQQAFLELYGPDVPEHPL
eukprot:TRINITY_DN39339_c0_g1_i1.p1 TRINITY_DN39339_c0_g1~~TRINITY_DN39339_c0_g1_i1.p1  ORF type:complete len:548 (-),score=122.60 TRINITY_DN39339_c0_g1_i1:23-1666(-)